MSRIRSIHPGLFTDEAFMSASAHARLLIIGIWTEAWDDGVFEWKPLTLKARIFPVDAVNVSELLDELAGLGIIKQFECGKSYGAVRNFQKFQRPKKPNRSGVLTPDLEVYVGKSETGSELVPHQSETSPEKPPQMEDGGGRMEEKVDTASAASTAPRHDYDEIERRCRLAAGLENEPSPNLFNLSPIVQLLDKGADLDRDVLPVLRAKAAGPKKARSWNWFVPAIVEAMQPHAAVAKLPPPKTPEDERAAWSRMLRSHAGGYWNDHWGPPPGSPGCKIPADFIASQQERAA